jgi:tetratricopeptide (TPR) repeat protein
MRRHAGALADAGKLAETLSRLGQLYVDAGKLAAARAVLAPAAEAALVAGSPLAQAEVLRVEAVLDRSTGDNAEALDRCDRALALCGLEGRAPLLQRAQILVIKGTVLWYLSRLHEATLAHGEALVIYRKLRVPRQEARALNNIGIVFSALGDFEEALSSYKRALRIDQELGDRAQVAAKLANIGQVYVECGDTDRAEAYLKKALALGEQLGDAQVAADASITLGQAYLKRGEILRARKVLEHGLAVATSLRESYQEIRGRLYLALARLECGDSPERAVAEARLAGELARKAPLPIGEIYAHVVAALALARLGRPQDAEAAAATAIQRLDETGAHEGADEVLFVHARLARAAGLDKRADASLARAVAEVQTRARRMKDPEMRRIYLAAAPARDILVAAGAQGPE